MQNFSFEDAVENFSSLVDEVVTRHQVVAVDRSPQESFVMISKDDYNAISGTSAGSDGDWVDSIAPMAITPPETRNTLGGWF